MNFVSKGEKDPWNQFKSKTPGSAGTSILPSSLVVLQALPVGLLVHLMILQPLESVWQVMVFKFVGVTSASLELQGATVSSFTLCSRLSSSVSYVSSIGSRYL